MANNLLNALSKGFFLSIIGLALGCKVVADDSIFIEEIIVTAQKREQSAQDVGISIATFSADKLNALSLDSATDIAAFVPGVNLSGSFAGQLQNFSIRGVTQNDVLDHTEAPSSVYIDEGYVAALNAQGLSLFDIKQLDVLKGPQGTLFGRNATGGAVIITTQKPSLEKTEGFARLRYADYEQANESTMEAAVGGPISKTSAARVAVTISRQGEYYNNLFPGGVDLGGSDSWGIRGHLLIQPNDNLNVLMTAHSAEKKLDTPPYQSLSTRNVLDANGSVINAIVVNEPTELDTVDPDGSDFDILHDFSAHNKNLLELYGATLKLDSSMDNITLTSVTDYKAFHKEFFIDADVTEVGALNTIHFADTDSFSQEVRTFRDGKDFRSYFGLYYLYIRSDIPKQGIDLPQNDLVILDEDTLTTNSYSVFYQLEKDITDQLTLIGGLRIIKEEKDFDYASNQYARGASPLDDPGELIGPARDPIEDKSSDILTSVKAEIDYRPTDTSLLFASYNRGVKAGSFNTPFGGTDLIPLEEVPYDEEILNAYEIGFKSLLYDRRVQLNGSVYYYDYKDYQAFRLIELSTQVINTTAEHYGAEFELDAYFTRNLSFFLSLAYLHTTVEDVDFNGVIEDREAAFSPEYSANAILKYEFDTLNGLFSFQAEANYNSSYFFALSNFDATEVPAYLISNVRLAYEPDNKQWRASAFIENLTDKRNETVGFDLSAFCGCTEVAYGQPRKLGLTLEYRFN